MTDMMLLPARQAEMRDIADGLQEDLSSKVAVQRIRKLIKMEQKSAEGSQATIDRSDHMHVKKSGEAALRNRLATIDFLQDAIEAIKTHGERGLAASLLREASNAGGKKSVKAARKQPTVALFVQYLAETDPDFQAWLATQGVRV